MGFNVSMLSAEMKKVDTQRDQQERRVRELEEMREREQKDQEQRRLEGLAFSLSAS